MSRQPKQEALRSEGRQSKNLSVAPDPMWEPSFASQRAARVADNSGGGTASPKVFQNKAGSSGPARQTVEEFLEAQERERAALKKASDAPEKSTTTQRTTRSVDDSRGGFASPSFLSLQLDSQPSASPTVKELLKSEDSQRSSHTKVPDVARANAFETNRPARPEVEEQRSSETDSYKELLEKTFQIKRPTRTVDSDQKKVEKRLSRSESNVDDSVRFRPEGQLDALENTVGMKRSSQPSNDERGKSAFPTSLEGQQRKLSDDSDAVLEKTFHMQRNGHGKAELRDASLGKSNLEDSLLRDTRHIPSDRSCPNNLQDSLGDTRYMVRGSAVERDDHATRNSIVKVPGKSAPSQATLGGSTLDDSLLRETRHIPSGRRDPSNLEDSLGDTRYMARGGAHASVDNAKMDNDRLGSPPERSASSDAFAGKSNLEDSLLRDTRQMRRLGPSNLEDSMGDTRYIARGGASSSADPAPRKSIINSRSAPPFGDSLSDTLGDTRIMSRSDKDKKAKIAALVKHIEEEDYPPSPEGPTERPPGLDPMKLQERLRAAESLAWG